MISKLLLLSLLTSAVPSLSFAAAWSTCQTITAVSDYTTHSNSVYLVLSPGIPGCSSDVAGAAILRVGQMGVTSDSIKSLMATSMIAYVAGKPVMIYYDNSSAACFASIISVGGYSAQCN